MMKSNSTLHKIFMIVTVRSLDSFAMIFNCVAQHRHLKKFSISSRCSIFSSTQIFVDSIANLLRTNQVLWSLKFYALPSFTEERKQQIKAAFVQNCTLREFNFTWIPTSFIKSIGAVGGFL